MAVANVVPSALQVPLVAAVEEEEEDSVSIYDSIFPFII
jgi:hypothetical protein